MDFFGENWLLLYLLYFKGFVCVLFVEWFEILRLNFGDVLVLKELNDRVGFFCFGDLLLNMDVVLDEICVVWLIIGGKKGEDCVEIVLLNVNGDWFDILFIVGILKDVRMKGLEVGCCEFRNFWGEDMLNRGDILLLVFEDGVWKVNGDEEELVVWLNLNGEVWSDVELLILKIKGFLEVEDIVSGVFIVKMFLCVLVLNFVFVGSFVVL